MALRVLVVTDGNRFTFDPTSTIEEGVFSIDTVVNVFRNSEIPTITVDTAHRRGATEGETHTTIPGNFNFHTSVPDLSVYDVIWIIADEGYNGDTDFGSDILHDENIVLAQFMEGGGGVFAVGDHDGIGAHMCGALPRVRTMRRWFKYDHVPAGFPANWSTGGTVGGSPQGIARADTLRPDSADGKYYFYGQSDPTPQPVTFPPGPVHQIMQGPSGPIGSFPDHMHEGEAIELDAGSPFLAGIVQFNGETLGTKTFTEFPAVGGAGSYHERPTVIAHGTEIGGHTTLLDGSTYVPTDGKTIGIVSAYDGHNVGVGRILTGSTFHHYLDINLLGDPTTNSTTPGVGPTNSESGLPADVLAGMTAYYLNAVTWLARPNPRCYLWVEKSTFGLDEVDDSPSYADAFWIVLDGFSPAQVGSTPAVAFGGAFAKIPSIHVASGTPVPQFPGSPNAAQRILIPCSITFTLPQPAGVFPVSPAPARPLLLEASVTFGGHSEIAEGVFELVAGADPYFTNIEPGTNHPAWLSADLRVFTVTPGINPAPFLGTTFTGAMTTLDPNAAYQYIQGVLSTLNASHHTPTSPDPLDSLPQQAGAFNGDSSVTPNTPNPGHPSTPFINYNFAVARVRLKGSAGASASPVKVFFRLFATQSNDTDYQPGTTYLSTLDGSGLPAAPLLGPGNETIPFFATGNYPGTGDYAPGATNNRTIALSGGATSTWAYFGCFLNVYDSAYLGGQPVQARLPGTHHCIVAQIAYDGAPIINSGGLTLSPGNSDKLAQRNLQVTSSANPGVEATHRIPQTFDLRPSPAPAQSAGKLLEYVDELMIDWGNTPRPSRASIYWPAVEARQVLQIASSLYPSHRLWAADAHTIQCDVTAGPTFIPIPPGVGANFAGLFTVDLPPTVVAGQQFRIVVRRGSTRRFQARATKTALVALAASEESQLSRNWRYGVGTFQVTIPVAHKDVLLAPEESTLAILKWRLSVMPRNDRWYPVLERYVAYVAARVDGFGGNAGGIAPSPHGYLPGRSRGGHGLHGGRAASESIGKVTGLCYDRFGDFEGFFLLTEDGEERAFRSQEDEIGRLVRVAWAERFVISVFAPASEPHEVSRIVLRRASRERER
jgi:hypothetical protein